MLIVLMACEPVQPITGSDDVFVLNGAQIVITGYSLSSNTLTATGTIKNTSTGTYTPVWYLEGDFYTDSTFTFKLGGTNKTYNFALGANETTAWELRFSSSTVDVNNHPNFRVKNLRAYRNKD
jgi:hypothetical protein